MPSVQFVCLANSRKMGGRCVAGVRLDDGRWIRPISSLPDGTLSPNQCVLTDGSEASLLDVVEVDVTRHRPEPHQPENWELAPGVWRLVQRIPLGSAAQYLSPVLVAGPALLGSQRDRIAYATFQSAPAVSSLALIAPRILYWNITTGFSGNRQTRCYFDLNGAVYDLSVTDLKFVQRISTLPLGLHPLAAAGITTTERVFLTVSMSEPFPKTGDCYKLVAAVFVLP